MTGSLRILTFLMIRGVDIPKHIAILHFSQRQNRTFLLTLSECRKRFRANSCESSTDERKEDSSNVCMIRCSNTESSNYVKQWLPMWPHRKRFTFSLSLSLNQKLFRNRRRLYAACRLHVKSTLLFKNHVARKLKSVMFMRESYHRIIQTINFKLNRIWNT